MARDLELDPMISMADVCRITGYSRQHIYRMTKAGEFPPPYAIGLNRIGWRRSAVEAWLKALPHPSWVPAPFRARSKRA